MILKEFPEFSPLLKLAGGGVGGLGRGAEKSI
jgi:hypothetical protein